ncbi:MAG: ATP-binding cassette domain-containing protein [Propionibacteriaceae bacterium]|nr:ATP-binding cassette domain-containing protein [Propionibacteriaceae bacterium]
MSEPRLDIRGVSKTFFPYSVNERVALDDVSLQLEDGDFVTVIGSNGAGKSTLLSVVAGLYRPERGRVLIDGVDVTGWPEPRMACRVGRVFQDPMAGTSPGLTIEENLAVAAHRGRVRNLGWGITAAKRAWFRQQLAVLGLGLEDRLTTRAAYLSGGQRQALSLVMATFTRPDILLLDEHTAALDPQRAELITRLTQQEVAANKLTTLMVTHNMAQALRLGNRLIMMHAGRIVLELADEAKANASIDDLLAEFEKRAALTDRTLLA